MKICDRCKKEVKMLAAEYIQISTTNITTSISIDLCRDCPDSIETNFFKLIKEIKD